MSTKTQKLEFLKPELTDAADITAYNGNWDKLDANLSHKNILTYTSTEQAGWRDASLDPEGFAGNISTLANALDGNAAILMLILDQDTHPNLHASVIKQLNIDVGLSLNVDDHLGWMFIRFSGEQYRSIFVEVNIETENEHNYLWTCSINRNSDGITYYSKFKPANVLYEHNVLLTNLTDAISFTIISKSPTPITKETIASIVSSEGITTISASGAIKVAISSTTEYYPVYRVTFTNIASATLNILYVSFSPDGVTKNTSEYVFHDTVRVIS